MGKKWLVIIIAVAILYWWSHTPTYVDEATQITLNYHIRYPAGGSAGDSLPVIIALHGNGDTYSNFYDFTLKDLTTPARIILLEAPKKYWPYDPSQLEQYSAAIASFAQQMSAKYTTQEKPVLLGFSGGGVMAYYSALTHCDSYSTIVPISGMLRTTMLPEKINMDNDCTVMAFHGTKDQVVGFSSGQFAINELKKHSTDVNLTSFDAGHHGLAFEFKEMILGEVGKKL